jgi:hypothetical protein
MDERQTMMEDDKQWWMRALQAQQMWVVLDSTLEVVVDSIGKYSNAWWCPSSWITCLCWNNGPTAHLAWAGMAVAHCKHVRKGSYKLHYYISSATQLTLILPTLLFTLNKSNRYTWPSKGLEIPF